ncbi:MAG: 16S rRNA (uracil(1498)-N(3))-methyltransferase [Actinomycetota bacterium]
MLSVFIVDEIPQSGEIFITGDEAHHAVSVVRISVGDEVMVTDGRGKTAHVKVSSTEKKSLRGAILTTEVIDPSATRITVVQALTKGDRARETIELLTEAGVDVIVPWSSQRSIGQWKDDAQSKWESWAREATKQSRRAWIPEISSVHSTSMIVDLIKANECSLVFHESSDRKLSQILKGKVYKGVLIVIGPEGGLADAEIDAFVASGATVVGLGKPVFRSAHAGAAALAAVQTALGIW